MVYILVNQKSHNGANKNLIDDVKKIYEGKEVEVKDVIELEPTIKEFFNTLTENDEVLLVGGDGTLMHFVNNIDGITLPCKVYFYAAGTGNDFKNDMKDKVDEFNRIYLNDVVVNLPTVIVKGKSYKFINGIGFGIDGYCCEEGDRLQTKSDKPVNYTAIAIKGLLFKFHPSNAKVTVDGVTKEYKKVWMAPTMKGRFYGGGMMVTPDQDRYNEDGLVSTCVLYKSGKIKTLMVFPTIFEGKHVAHTEMIEVRTGHDVIVEFDKPQALQIDGETITDVLSYEVHTK